MGAWIRNNFINISDETRKGVLVGGFSYKDIEPGARPGPAPLDRRHAPHRCAAGGRRRRTPRRYDARQRRLYREFFFFMSLSHFVSYNELLWLLWNVLSEKSILSFSSTIS